MLPLGTASVPVNLGTASSASSSAVVDKRNGINLYKAYVYICLPLRNVIVTDFGTRRYISLPLQTKATNRAKR